MWITHNYGLRIFCFKYGCNHQTGDIPIILDYSELEGNDRNLSLVPGLSREECKNWVKKSVGALIKGNLQE